MSLKELIINDFFESKHYINVQWNKSIIEKINKVKYTIKIGFIYK
jgi:hypothetical protein